MSSTPTPSPAPAELLARRADPIPPILAVLLALGLLAQLLLPPAALPISGGGGAARLASDAGPPSAPLASADPAILARPLFSQTRSGAALQSAAAPGALALLGVAFAGRRALATLRDGAGAAQTLSPGEDIEGWRLESVSRGAAVLRRGGDLQTLRIGEAAALPSPSSPGAPRAPANEDR